MTSIEHFEHHYGQRIYSCIRILNHAREKFRNNELDGNEVDLALHEIEQIYDKPVHDFIEDQILNEFVTGTTSSQIIDLGMKINHRYGTEMIQVLNAIEDFRSNLGIGEDEDE